MLDRLGRAMKAGISAFALPVSTNSSIPNVAVDELDPFAVDFTNAANCFWDGSKYPGSFGSTKLHTVDYWTLRARSAQLYNDNLYARGLIRRLVTNEINTGLTLEATPTGSLLNIDDDLLADWSEDVENRFTIWAKNPKLCDFKQKKTFGKLQRQIRTEALVNGDVLIVQRFSRITKLPSIQIIPGGRVNTPIGVVPRKGNEIKQGVEFDRSGREVAYWINEKSGQKAKRVPAFGEKSGRRLSWLVFGSDKREDEIRGQPLLSIVLSSIAEIDKYRDSEQRAATVNSVLAMFIKKTEDKIGTLPITGGATRRDAVSDQGSADTTPRNYTLNGQIPGLVFEELQTGEEPVSYDTKRPNVNFEKFEAAIINAIAWANEIPPEVLTLAFSSNYSASRGAVNEFKIYLNKIRSDFSEELCEPIYQDWLISSVLLRQVDAPELLEAWRDSNGYNTTGAWFSSEWGGAIKPAVDLLKEAKGYQVLVSEGWIDNDRSSKELTGTKFSKNIKRIKRENEQKADAMRPLLEISKEFGTAEADKEKLTDKNTGLSLVQDNESMMDNE